MPNYLAEPLPEPDAHELDLREAMTIESLIAFRHPRVYGLLAAIERAMDAGNLSQLQEVHMLEDVLCAHVRRLELCGKLGVRETVEELAGYGS